MSGKRIIAGLERAIGLLRREKFPRLRAKGEPGDTLTLTADVVNDGRVYRVKVQWETPGPEMVLIDGFAWGTVTLVGDDEAPGVLASPEED